MGEGLMVGLTKEEELWFGKQYERAAADWIVANHWPGAQLIANPSFADLDWQVVRDGQLEAWLEIKTRRIASTSYDSTLVAYRKHLAARYGMDFFHVPTYCVVLYTDTAAMFPLQQAPDAVRMMMRRDRDARPMAHALYRHARCSWFPQLVADVRRMEGGR